MLLVSPRPVACAPTLPTLHASDRCNVVAAASRNSGPRTADARRRLTELGVNTDGVFERSELLRLLETAEERAADAPPPIASMDLQAIMNELEERGVDFDVLAPQPALMALLQKARRATPRPQPATARTAYSAPPPSTPVYNAPPARPPPSPPAAAASPAPPAPRAPPPAPPAAPADEAPVQRTTRGASPHRDLSSLVGEAVTSAVDVAGVVADKLAPTVGGVIDELAPAAKSTVKAAAETASEMASKGAEKLPNGVVQRVRGWLQKARPPPKPVLLLLCVAALRYGLVRTALIASAAKLTIDISNEAVAAVRQRVGGGRAGGDAASGPQGAQGPPPGAGGEGYASASG